MKQKLGSRARGTQAAKRAEAGFHFGPHLLQEEIIFLMQDKVFAGLNTRLLGLLLAGHMRGIFML